MTDIELLPSSVAAFVEALKGERGSLDAWLEVNNEREVAAHVEAYARAVAEHNVAAKDAEIEALRAEVDEARGLVIEANNSLYGSQGYFHSLNGGAYDRHHLSRGIEDLKTSSRARYAAEARAERLAEALRELVALGHPRDPAIIAARTALRDHDQEVSNG